MHPNPSFFKKWQLCDWPFQTVFLNCRLVFILADFPLYNTHCSCQLMAKLTIKKKIKNSTDDCCNLLCTLYLAGTLHSFSLSPSAISSLFLLLIEKLNICFLKSIWIVKLPIHWHVVGSGCHARVSRHVQWVALCTGSSVWPTHGNPSGSPPIPRSF